MVLERIPAYTVWKHAEASWRMWLRAAGINSELASRGPHFTVESMAVQAAVDSQGVALIGDVLVADEIAAGRLVKPFNPNLSTPLTFSFYLLTTHGSAKKAKVEAFRNWLLNGVRRLHEQGAKPSSDVKN